MILNQIVEDLQDQKDILVVGFVCDKELFRRECLKEIEQLDTRDHAELLGVWRDVAHNCEQAFKHGSKQSLVGHNNLVEDLKGRLGGKERKRVNFE